MSLSEIDLNLLLVLDAVLSEQSVARAARRLHVTPSAISNALARLRLVLGDPLVVRSGRGIVPTPRAAGLAPSLRHALQYLEQVVQPDRFDPATSDAKLTLALTDAGQLSRLPRLVQLLQRTLPRARLRVVGIDTYVSSGGLAGTEVDVAIVGVIDAAPDIHSTVLYMEESVLVARRGHRGATGRLTKSRLAELRHVDVQVAPGRGYSELARRYERAGIAREVSVIVPSFIAAAAVVAATDLVATLPASLIEVLGERLGLRVVEAPAPKIAFEIKLVWHERTHHDAAMRAFRDIVVESAREVAGPSRAPRR